MRQKYFLRRDHKKHQLTIQEHVDSQRESRTRDDFRSDAENFELVSEGSYPDAEIVAAVSQGEDAVIDLLRTRNFYPIKACADLLAASIRDLYQDDGENALTVFFDDMDLLQTEDEEIETSQTE